jgi:hypothetical protein
MIGAAPVFRPSLLLKSIRAGRIAIGTRGEFAIAASLLALCLALGADSLVTTLVVWLLCF